MTSVTHFDVSMDTKGVELEDGTKAIILSFCDKELDRTEIYPINIITALDIAKEIINLGCKLYNE